MREARLILEDGTVFCGRSFGYDGETSGEVVFNTAMTGYPESLTDPSYAGQKILAKYVVVEPLPLVPAICTYLSLS